MTIAITFEFTAVGDQIAGWSETFYSAATNLTIAYGIASTLSYLRCQCLSQTVNMPWCKLSPQPIGSGVPLLVNCNKDPNFASSGAISSAADYQVVKGLLRLVATTGQSTRQPFGGIPGSQFGVNGAFTLAGQFATALKGFLAVLVSNGMCIRKVNNPVPTPPNQGGFYKQPINSISIAGVLNVPNNLIPLGVPVYVGRVAPNYGLRGFWKVQTNDGNNITLQGWKPSPTQIPNTKGQYIQLYQYLFPAIALNPGNVTNPALVSTIIRSSKHAVGRPKNPTIGRRKRPVK